MPSPAASSVTGPRTALVYPPYGPPNLANLGIANLSAGLHARGLVARTFYWNFRLAEAIPADSQADRQRIYTLFSQRDLFPWNEWIFSRLVFGERAPNGAEVDAQLDLLDRRAAAICHPYRPSALVRALAEAAPRLVEEMAAELRDFELIGISSTFYQNGAALALARYLKETRPEALVILGGANCDGEMGRAIADNFPFVDGVFVGEADHSFPDFVARLRDGLPTDDVPGLILRDPARGLVEGPETVPVVDMDGVPTPDFDDYIEERKRFGLFDPETLVLPMESSRGCWWGAKHHCTFCGLNANGMNYRQKTDTRFREQIVEIVGRYGARFLFMADNILSARYYRDFVQWAKENDINVSYFYEIKSNVTRAHVADLADAGITMVQPGIESFSTPILRMMRKGVRGIQNIAFLKYAREYGIIPAWNILGGFPGEDPFEYERMAGTVPQLAHLSPPNGVIDIEFHRFSPYHNDAAAFGLHLRPHRSYFTVFPLPEAEVARLAYVFEAEGRSPFSLSYLAGLNDAVRHWIADFRLHHALLDWKAEGDSLLVRDRRPGLPRADYRLEGYAADVFLALDAPIKVEALATGMEHRREAMAASAIGPGPAARAPRRPPGEFAIVPPPAPAPETVIRFDRPDFEAAPDACLRPLVEAGIVYRDEDLFIALPTAARGRRIDDGWRRIGI